MQLIQGQGLDQVIDELRRLVAGRRLTRRPGRAEGPEAPRPSPARVAATRPPERELGQMAESLLSGRLVTEGPESPATDSPRLPVATERFDPTRPRA